MTTVDISGMGGGYEAVCQKALMNGMRFVREHPDADLKGAYKTYQNLYGIATPETQIAHDLDKSLGNGIPDNLGMTGAMHQAVIGHILYIAKNGYDKWLGEFGDQPDRIYETDEDKVDTILLIEDVEWQLKLDSGYNWVEELKKIIPEKDWIILDPTNPKPAIQELKRRLDIT